MLSPRLYACAPGLDERLQAELATIFVACAPRLVAPGWVGCDLTPEEELAVRAVAFAQQCMPRPSLISAPSVSAFAREATHRLIEGLAGHDGPWRLHVYCHDVRGSELRPRRAALIEADIVAALKKKQRRLVRSRVDGAQPWLPGEVLAQLALVAPDLAYLSLAAPADRAIVRRVLSRFPGGRPVVAEDPRPPSRAYLKLLEAELHLGRAISRGERCVDLGGSPGGWTFVALDRGAHVTAVDRSPLREDLMEHPDLAFAKADAFKFLPEARVDWLLCDVIAEPSRSLELLDRWLADRLCARFVVTLKFKGEPDLELVTRAKRLLDTRGAEYLLRRLEHNKNELTAMGSIT